MYELADANFTIPEPRLIIQNNESVWPSAVGAFLGAFFAFGFGVIAFYLQKKFERYWKGKNTVVEIEHLLNDHLNTISGNRYLFGGAINTLKKNNMTYTLLAPFRLPKDINLRIGNLDLLNKYSDYKEPVEKVNHGMKAWQGLNEQLHQTVIANPGTPPTIVHKNMNHIQGQAETLLKFLNALEEDTRHFLAYIRIYMRKDKHIWSIWLLEMQNKDKPVVTKSEVKKELKKLQKEVEEISAESRKRIAKIMGG